jgi:DNA-damage-inducible protein J
MSKTSVINIRTDKELKDKAESILKKLGISPSQAINIFYSQITIHNGLPFDLKLPEENVSRFGKKETVNDIIDELLNTPLKSPEFKPLSRNKVHERKQ